MISQRLEDRRRRGRIRKASEISHHRTFNGTSNIVKIPLRSGADRGLGQYFVSFRVGSPPQKFVLIADTGSDLTWMHCNHKGENCPKDGLTPPNRMFQADASSTFKTIPCSSRTCKVDLQDTFSLSMCPTPNTPCAYDYSYFDGSKVRGFFANETVTAGSIDRPKKVRLKEVTVGCTDWANGNFHNADGVLGLGFGKNSFAATAAKLFDNKFSYCLVDHLSPSNFANFLNFGNTSKQHIQNMQHTQLILGELNPFYAVNVSGISIAGKMLNVPPEMWHIHGAGGVILDSGTTLTFLGEPAYAATVAALRAPLEKYKKLGHVLGPLRFCYNDPRFDMADVPQFVLHFADGAKFVPPKKSYVIDADVGVKCIGFASAGWPANTVIGNIMQQNHLWEFDLANHRLGYAPSTCDFHSQF